jgi:hypothetical protein
MLPASQLHTPLPLSPFGDGISDSHTYVVISETELQAEAFKLYRTKYMTDYNTEPADATTESPQIIQSSMQRLWATIRNSYFIETDAERHTRATAQLRLEIAELTAKLKRPRSPEPPKPNKHPKHAEENKG